MPIPIEAEAAAFYTVGKDAGGSFLAKHPHATAEELVAWLVERAPKRLPKSVAEDYANRIAERLLRQT